jgi:hypothetical protein
LSTSLTGIGQLESRLGPGRQLQLERHFIAQGAVARQFTPDFAAAISLRYGYEKLAIRHAVGARRRRAVGARQPAGSRVQGLRNRSVRSSASSSLPSSMELRIGCQRERREDTTGRLRRTQFFSPTLVLGIGAGIFRQIARRASFAFIVNWQIDEHWRVSNPFRRSGRRRGVEIVRALGGQWELAAGRLGPRLSVSLRDDGPARTASAQQGVRCSRG